MKFIKPNKKQKTTIKIGLLIITVSICIWLLFGGEIFTKTQVIVEVKDELFDMTYKEWRDKFIWGLDLSLAVSAITILISFIIIFFQKNKRGKNENQIS